MIPAYELWMCQNFGYFTYANCATVMNDNVSWYVNWTYIFCVFMHSIYIYIFGVSYHHGRFFCRAPYPVPVHFMVTFLEADDRHLCIPHSNNAFSDNYLSFNEILEIFQRILNTNIAGICGIYHWMVLNNAWGIPVFVLSVAVVGWVSVPVSSVLVQWAWSPS